MSEPVKSPSRRRLPKPLRSGLAYAGFIIILVWIIIAIFAPLIEPFDPLAQDFPRLQPPSSAHPFGTDESGRDVLSRVIAGAQVTFPLSIALVFFAMIIGSILGAIAGFFGKIVGEIIMRLADLVYAFPIIILAMVIAAALGPSLRNAVIAMLFVTWPTYARVTRSLVLGASKQEYVVSGRLLGAGPFASLARDIAPNVIAPVVVLATLDVGTATLLLSSLSFLGLGSVPPMPDWGAMVASGMQNFSSWWLAAFPGLAILTVVVAFNFLGDALRDALDPRSQEAVVGGRGI